MATQKPRTPRAQNPGPHAPSPNGAMPFQPPAQQWLCAVCVAGGRAWEAQHHDEIMAAIAKLPDLPEGTSPLAILAAQGIAPPPNPNLACTIATLDGYGTCALCPAHVPPDPAAVPARKSLLVATAALSSSLIAAARNG